MGRTALVAVAMSVTTSAAAEPSAESRAAYAEAQAHYEAGRFHEAGEGFGRTYQLDPDPAYLFNAAQSYRQSRECDKALDYFRRFRAAVPEIPEPENTRVTQFTREAEVCAVDQAHIREHERRAAVEQSREVERHSRAHTMRTVGMITLGVGVVGLGVGTYFAIHAHRLSSRVDDCLRSPTCMVDPSWANDGERADTAAKLLLPIGAAAAITGGVLLYLGVRDRGVSPVTVEPKPGGAAVTWTGTF